MTEPPRMRAGNTSAKDSNACIDTARVCSSRASSIPSERYTASVSFTASDAVEKSTANGFNPKRRNIINTAAPLPPRDASTPPVRARSVSALRRKSPPIASPVGANESTKNAPIAGVASGSVRSRAAIETRSPQRSPSRTVTSAIKTGHSIPIIIVGRGRQIAASA